MYRQLTRIFRLLPIPTTDIGSLKHPALIRLAIFYLVLSPSLVIASLTLIATVLAGWLGGLALVPAIAMDGIAAVSWIEFSRLCVTWHRRS